MRVLNKNDLQVITGGYKSDNTLVFRPKKLLVLVIFIMIIKCFKQPTPGPIPGPGPDPIPPGGGFPGGGGGIGGGIGSGPGG